MKGFNKVALNDSEQHCALNSFVRRLFHMFTVVLLTALRYCDTTGRYTYKCYYITNVDVYYGSSGI